VQGFAQPSQPEHLRSQGVPKPRTVHRRRDPASGVRLFQRVPHRDGEQPAHRVVRQFGQQPVQILGGQTGPGGVVDQHPITRHGLFQQRIQPVQYRMAAFHAAGDD